MNFDVLMIENPDYIVWFSLVCCVVAAVFYLFRKNYILLPIDSFKLFALVIVVPSILLICLDSDSSPRNLFIKSYANGNYKHSNHMKDCLFKKNSADILRCFDIR